MHVETKTSGGALKFMLYRKRQLDILLEFNNLGAQQHIIFSDIQFDFLCCTQFATNGDTKWNGTISPSIWTISKNPLWLLNIEKNMEEIYNKQGTAVLWVQCIVAILKSCHDLFPHFT